MTPRCPHNRSSGFGVLDLLAMIAIGLILAMLLLPSLGRGSKKRAPRLHCTSNLRQVALGIRMWADDHQDQYPFVVSASKGGSLEFAETPDVFRHFLAASNELHSPKILACPADLETRKETYWTNLSNVNVSYFVGLDAREELPQRILAGDRNINGGTIRGGVMVFSNESMARFTTEIHNYGNYVLADGSAAQATTDMLRKQLKTGDLPVRFAIPNSR